HDPTRWNWSRKAFAREPENARCRAALEPVMEELVAAWAALGRHMDRQLTQDGESDPTTQAQVDELYATCCFRIREALTDIACWQPSTANRGPQRHHHLRWQDLDSL
ncbi:hypothetical protein B5P40_32230, partial [Bacillus sp. SRB_8]